MNDYMEEMEKKVEKALEGEASRIELTLMDKVRGVKGALKRLIASGVLNPESYCSAAIGQEREVCCTTCTKNDNCPYCGCSIRSKKLLATEPGCPNPKTYPHLKKFPPRDYWSVCGKMVSVVIAAANEPHLNKTIKSLFENATGPIEVIVVLDGAPAVEKVDERARVITNQVQMGKKVCSNKGVAASHGDYIFIIDAHCIMSFGWDTKLKCACTERTLVASVIKTLLEETWELKPGAEAGTGYAHVYLNTDLRERWWKRPPVNLIEELMCLTGCGWMIQKQYYDKLGGFDERFGLYGGDGVDWALKVWLHKTFSGKVLLHNGVVCGHLFGSNKGNKLYPIRMISQQHHYALLLNEYGMENILKLVKHFAPVPGWEDVTKEKMIDKARGDQESEQREIKVEKEQIRETRDKAGKVIRREKLIYEPVYEHDDGTGDLEEIEARLVKQATEVARVEELPI